MEIDNDLVDRIAELARLEFQGREKEDIKKDLVKILALVDQLNELETDDIEPLIYMTDETNVLREDVAETTISQNEALMNAPKKDSDYFKVPKVISKE